MEGDEESSAAEAALGFIPHLFVNEVLNMVDDVRGEAFEYCLQEGAPEAVGTATATHKAEELEWGINDIHLSVKDVLDKRMSNWEKYCLRHCFTVPEGFVAPEDDNPSSKELHKDGNYDSELDAELDFLRKKLENANKESEQLQTECSTLEKQTISIAEVSNLFEDKCVQENIQGTPLDLGVNTTRRKMGRRNLLHLQLLTAFVNAIPKLHQKLKVLKRKRTGLESMMGLNGLGDQKRLAMCKGFTPSTEEIREVNETLNSLPME